MLDELILGDESEVVQSQTEIVLIKGAPGNNGVGINGKSAYELAKSKGYTGTESQWLDSLKGKDGEDGLDGEDGTPGTIDYEEVGEIIDSKLEGLIKAIGDISKDGVLTPMEKRMILLEKNQIVSENQLIKDRGTLYELTSLLAAYNAAYDALIVYLTPLLLVMNEASAIDPALFQNKFNALYISRSTLLKQINLIIKQDAEQTRLTAEGAAAITDFWSITLDDRSGIIAAGTMLVGTGTLNNAGMTGVTDNGQNSVRFFAGATYANKNIAPFRVLNNGKIWSGTTDSGWDFGITSPDRFTIRGGLTVDSGGNVAEIDTPRGVYVPGAIYYKGNTVTFAGSLWRYTNDSPSAVAPVEGDYWTIIISKGVDGENGSDGQRAPFVIDRGIYDPLLTYHGGDDYIEVVTHEDKAYHTLQSSGNFTGILPTNTGKWDLFTVQFKSLFVNVLSAITAQIDQLIARTVMTAMSGQRITINETAHPNSLRFYNGTGNLAIEMAEEGGVAKLIFYDANGNKVYEAGQSGIVYVTVVPESWSSSNFITMPSYPKNPSVSEQGSMKSFLQQYVTGDGSNTVVLATNYTAHNYQNGVNPNANDNLQYVGFHTVQTKSLTNWIPDGWYAASGNRGLNSGKYTVLVNYFEGGQRTNTISLVDIPYNGNQ